MAQTGLEVRLAGHTVTLQLDEQEVERKIRAIYSGAGLAPPNAKEVIAGFDTLAEKQVKQVMEHLVKQEVLIKLNETLYFDAKAVQQLQESVVAYIRKEGEIDAQRFKDLTGLTRKFSIPLLEYFDKIKLTIRIDDKRVLRKG